jgi:hypothetical protein
MSGVHEYSIKKMLVLRKIAKISDQIVATLNNDDVFLVDVLPEALSCEVN